MALDPLNSSNLEQLALKGLRWVPCVTYMLCVRGGRHVLAVEWTLCCMLWTADWRSQSGLNTSSLTSVGHSLVQERWAGTDVCCVKKTDNDASKTYSTTTPWHLESVSREKRTAQSGHTTCRQRDRSAATSSTDIACFRLRYVFLGLVCHFAVHQLRSNWLKCLIIDN